MKSSKTTLCIIFCIIVVVGIVLYKVQDTVFSISYSQPAVASSGLTLAKEPALEVPLPPPITHIDTPTEVRGLYMSACVAGTPSLRNKMVGVVERTEANTLIIDVKDYSGGISFVPNDASLVPYISTRCKVKDMQLFINELHEKDIYIIGRVTAFQDPLFTKKNPESAIRKKSDGGMWLDKNGLAYIDPASKDAWDHLVKIAEDAHNIGFDEINFDYIRYPSDGPITDIRIPSGEGSTKQFVLNSFFTYLHEKMVAAEIVHSADLFGMTTTNTDDLGIGQVLEDALRNFDFVAPMVYPSHYPPGWNNYSLPDKYPYEVIKVAMGKAVERATLLGVSPKKLRPWLQDFELHHVPYTADMVRKQMQASYDVGLDSWMLWDAANTYTESALLVK